MHPQAAEAIVASVRRREKQGDFPDEPKHGYEVLEDCILELAGQLEAAQAVAPPKERSLEAQRIAESAWPPRDVVTRLVECADILFEKHDYDGDGWEVLHSARAVARKWLASSPAAPATPSPTRHQVVLLGAHSGRSIAGALIPATETTLYVRQDEVLALFERASSGSTGADLIAKARADIAAGRTSPMTEEALAGSTGAPPTLTDSAELTEEVRKIAAWLADEGVTHDLTGVRLSLAPLIAAARKSSSPSGASGTEEGKLAKLGALALWMTNLSPECSEALLVDVLTDILTRGVLAREAYRKIAFGDHKVREG